MKREPTKEELNSRKRIIELITDHCGGSQNEFAKKVGIGKSSVSQYVNGRNFPSNVRAGEIAKAFGVNPMWVMGFDEEKYVTEEERHDRMGQRKLAYAAKMLDKVMYEQALFDIAERMKLLNTSGIISLVDYAEMLSKNEKYTEGGED